MDQIYVLTKTGCVWNEDRWETNVILASLNKELLEEKMNSLNKLEEKSDEWLKDFYGVQEIETI